MGEYKEDSTKGRAITEPINYKGDVMVQVWLDSRLLATLSNMLDNNGYFTRYMSEVVRETLELYMESAINSGLVKMVEDTGNARELLSRKYRIKLNKVDRGKRNILHNMILSERRIKDGMEKLRRKGNDIDNEATGLIEKSRLDSVVKRALDTYNEEFGAKKDVEENEKRINELMDVGEDGIMRMKMAEEPRKLTTDELYMREEEIAKKDREYRKELDNMENVKLEGIIKDDEV